MFRPRFRWAAAALAAALGVGLGVGVLPTAQSAPLPATNRLKTSFADAAEEYHVPERLLLAVSYALTRWDDHGSEPSASAGYGPMHLTHLDAASAAERTGRGEGTPATTVATGLDTLDQAARLLGVPARRLQTDPALNVRGGAALLAAGARKMLHGTPTDLAAWYPVVARYPAGAATAAQNAFADDVFALLRTGASRTTNTGQRLDLAPTASALPRSLAARGRDRAAAPAAECPTGVTCRFVPAAYTWNDAKDPNAYGNYDPATRPGDGNTLRYIVIHDTEASYDSAIATFGNPTSSLSAQYVIRSSDGEVTQMVRTRDLAWHSGNWNVNSQSIGIEHEGVAVEGATWYTETLYRSSARLVRYLADRYGIPLDRNHIVGHDEVMPRTRKAVAGAHWDPGPFWDWERYLELVGAPIPAGTAKPRVGDVVTLLPDFDRNVQPLTDTCPAGKCTTLPRQGSNVIPLRAAPSATAPLLGDPAIQTNGGAGTMRANDWGNKATVGRQYVLAARQGTWAAIWFAGKKGWYPDPAGTITRLGKGRKLAAKTGAKTIPAYGAAFPEPGEYPAEIKDRLVPETLLYTIPAGQVYVALEQTRANYYYARFDGAGVKKNHTLVKGAQVFWLISYNHRSVYVKASDIRWV